MTITLAITIEASTEEIAREMLDQLARVACDIANSTTDDDAHIWIDEPESCS